MTQEDKQLLLKDLSTRLPYGVNVKVREHISVNPLRIWGIYTPYKPKFKENKKEHYVRFWNNVTENIVFVKPYLRPMSSMTEKERGQRRNLLTHESMLEFEDVEEYVDWLLEHHFDYRGLIEKGLALEAPEGMYKFE